MSEHSISTLPESLLDVTVKVPPTRLSDFYVLHGRFLAGDIAVDLPAPAEDEALVPALPWGADDLPLAKVVWAKLSDRALKMAEALLENPGSRYTGEEIAELHTIPNGKYGVAGVLAWPGRHCAAVGRELFIRAADGEVGTSASYWIDPDVAALFRQARDEQR